MDDVNGNDAVVSRAPIVDMVDASKVYGTKRVLTDVTLRISERNVIGLIGPNGAGKSTLMRIMAGVLRPTSGIVRFRGQPLYTLNAKERATKIAYLSQNPHVGFGFRVEDIVWMGRYAHRSKFSSDDGNHQSVVKHAMERAGVLSLRHRRLNELSGGERQRVFFARAMAQQPELFFLDEPTAHLDMKYQLEILELAQTLNETERMTIVVAIHDLNLALRYCDRFIVVHDGRLVADGLPENVFTERFLRNVFEVDITVHRHPRTMRPRRVDYA